MIDDRYFKTPEDELIYEQIKRAKAASQAGDIVKRERVKTQITRKKKNKALVKVASLVVGAGILVSSISPVVANKLQDNAVINPLARDFQIEVMNEATHRTDDNSGYYFDDEEIANYINESENKDQDVYFLVQNISSRNLNDSKEQINSILEHTDMGDIDSIIEEKGYSDIDEYLKKEQKVIINNIKEENEKETMLEEDEKEGIIEGEKSL